MAPRDQSQLKALVDCASECERCVYEVCLGNPQMKQCGQLCIDCAQACWTTAAYVSRGSRFMNDFIGRCADICDACAAECERFEEEHMRRCAAACRQCASECRGMIGRAERAEAARM